MIPNRVAVKLFAPDPVDLTQTRRALARVHLPDPAIETTPFELFRALAEGRPVFLVDLRRTDAEGPTLRGAISLVPSGGRAEALRRLLIARAAAGELVAVGEAGPLAAVLIDETGSFARRLARSLTRSGIAVRSLYGGLALWRLSIVGELVGDDWLSTPRIVT